MTYTSLHLQRVDWVDIFNLMKIVKVLIKNSEMKQVYIVACILLCSFQHKDKGDPVKVITIIKTKMSIETVISVPCEDVGNLIPRDTFYIYEKDKQKQILQWIIESNPCNAHASCDIDSRARIFINHESGKTDSLCIGYGSVFAFNGKCMELPRRDLINMLIAMDRDIRPDEIEDSDQIKIK